MTERKLPVKQLVILAICRFAEPIALTSVYPYVPEMMESFGIPENDIARWAGVTSAIFCICQACTGLLWGAASDTYGRKPILLLGLCSTMWTMILWGTSTTLTQALIARGLEGLGNGNVGILRTTVAEMCPWKELQPLAFSVMPMVWTVGAVIGPSLGGLLSNPLRVDPKQPRGDKFLERFPYILPNIAASACFAVGIITGWLFLRETLESKKNQQDLGLRTGAKLTSLFRKTFGLRKTEPLNDEREPLLRQAKVAQDEEEQLHGVANDIIKEKAPRIRDVLSYQTSLNLLVYTLLAFYTMAYDQLLPVFMHHPPQSLEDPNVELPLKFAGGFGIDSQRIGLIFTIFAISSTIWQFVFFPPIVRYMGVLRCLRISFLIFPFVYFATPFISIIPDPTSKEIAMVILLMIRGLGGTFAFPTSTIMITNSAESLRVLGTINGIATSLAAIGRAIGPALGGGLFSWGVKRGYVIVPFWTLSALALLAAVPTFWLVEGDGFGDDSEEDDDVDDDPLVQHDEEQRRGKYVIDADDDTMQSESEFGEPANLLTLTSTRSSIAMESEDGGDFETDHHGRRRSSNALITARTQSTQGRRGNVVKRQSSVPIGMGKGFRRYSSNLGSTGVGASGTSWGGA